MLHNDISRLLRVNRPLLCKIEGVLQTNCCNLRRTHLYNATVTATASNCSKISIIPRPRFFCLPLKVSKKQFLFALVVFTPVSQQIVHSKQNRINLARFLLLSRRAFFDAFKFRLETARGATV